MPIRTFRRGPGGTTSAMFTILTGVVTTQTGVQIAASYGGATRVGALTLTP